MELYVDKKFDDKYRLENGHLIKKIQGYEPCTQTEVIEYFKDKRALTFNVTEYGFNGGYNIEENKEVYILSNDKVTAISLKGIATPVSDLEINKIFINDGCNCFIQVWSDNLKENMNAGYNGYMDIEDGYILQYNHLFKVVDQDLHCTLSETVNYFKNKAAIKIETEDKKIYYLSNDHAKVICNDSKISVLELTKLDIKYIFIHDRLWGWNLAWEKNDQKCFIKDCKIVYATPEKGQLKFE